MLVVVLMIILNFPIVPVLSLLLFHALLLRRARRATLPVVALSGSSRILSNISNCINYGSITVSGLTILPLRRWRHRRENFSKALLINVSIMEHFLLRILFTISTTSRAAVTSVVFADILTDSVIRTTSRLVGSQSPTASYSGNINGSVTISDSEVTSRVLLDYGCPDNAWNGKSTQTYIYNCSNTASKVNFIFNRALFLPSFILHFH